MYDFVTHTWNTVKGKCYHDCSYCYMKRFGNQKPVRFDEKELKTDLGKDNFIFVGSSCDMFAKDIPDEWIKRTLEHCLEYDKNKYLFQTKNPIGLLSWSGFINSSSVVCTTIETNRFYDKIMNNSPHPGIRASDMNELAHEGFDTYVTIEPIMDFDIDELSHIIETTLCKQVNIGADSGNNNLPEPSKEKIGLLIIALSKFTTVNIKPNLKRLYP